MDADRIRHIEWCFTHDKPATGAALNSCDNYILTSKDFEACRVSSAVITHADCLDGPTDEDIRIGTEAALRLNNVEPSEASIDLWSDYEEEVQVALEAVFQARKEEK